MNLNLGDFIISKYSKTPSLIISIQDNSYLTALTEYSGDYKWIQKTESKQITLDPSEELSILSKFGNWFYDYHKTIYQEIIIKNLYNYYLS
tara:strand:- start:1312 stop:1584 length:273 start_codon:yes stop_codon:yes gene_type:complete